MAGSRDLKSEDIVNLARVVSEVKPSLDGIGSDEFKRLILKLTESTRFELKDLSFQADQVNLIKKGVILTKGEEIKNFGQDINADFFDNKVSGTSNANNFKLSLVPHRNNIIQSWVDNNPPDFNNATPTEKKDILRRAFAPDVKGYTEALRQDNANQFISIYGGRPISATAFTDPPGQNAKEGWKKLQDSERKKIKEFLSAKISQAADEDLANLSGILSTTQPHNFRALESLLGVDANFISALPFSDRDWRAIQEQARNKASALAVTRLKSVTDNAISIQNLHELVIAADPAAKLVAIGPFWQQPPVHGDLKAVPLSDAKFADLVTTARAQMSQRIKTEFDAKLNAVAAGDLKALNDFTENHDNAHLTAFVVAIPNPCAGLSPAMLDEFKHKAQEKAKSLIKESLQKQAKEVKLAAAGGNEARDAFLALQELGSNGNLGNARGGARPILQAFAQGHLQVLDAQGHYSIEEIKKDALTAAANLLVRKVHAVHAASPNNLTTFATALEQKDMDQLNSFLANGAKTVGAAWTEMTAQQCIPEFWATLQEAHKIQTLKIKVDNVFNNALTGYPADLKALLETHAAAISTKNKSSELPKEIIDDLKKCLDTVNARKCLEALGVPKTAIDDGLLEQVVEKNKTLIAGESKRTIDKKWGKEDYLIPGKAKDFIANPVASAIMEEKLGAKLAQEWAVDYKGEWKGYKKGVKIVTLPACFLYDVGRVLLAGTAAVGGAALGALVLGWNVPTYGVGAIHEARKQYGVTLDFEEIDQTIATTKAAIAAAKRTSGDSQIDPHLGATLEAAKVRLTLAKNAYDRDQKSVTLQKSRLKRLHDACDTMITKIDATQKELRDLKLIGAAEYVFERDSQFPHVSLIKDLSGGEGKAILDELKPVGAGPGIARGVGDVIIPKVDFEAAKDKGGVLMQTVIAGQEFCTLTTESKSGVAVTRPYYVHTVPAAAGGGVPSTIVSQANPFQGMPPGSWDMIKWASDLVHAKQSQESISIIPGMDPSSKLTDAQIRAIFIECAVQGIQCGPLGLLSSPITKEELQNRDKVVDQHIKSNLVGKVGALKDQTLKEFARYYSKEKREKISQVAADDVSITRKMRR